VPVVTANCAAVVGMAPFHVLYLCIVV